MTDYKITGTAPALYVIQTLKHGITTWQDIKHGPYKNEESAKRRIRNLKAKESEVVKPIADNVAKITAASEYGKMTADPLRNLDMSGFKIDRQRGCYPAIPKHAYQR